jgi:hypothetical protein
MKTTIHLQLTPKWDDDGELVDVAAVRATKDFPHKPVPGAITMALAITLPPTAFDAIPVELRVPKRAIHTNPVVAAVRPDPDA